MMRAYLDLILHYITFKGLEGHFTLLECTHDSGGQGAGDDHFWIGCISRSMTFEKQLPKEKDNCQKKSWLLYTCQSNFKLSNIVIPGNFSWKSLAWIQTILRGTASANMDKFLQFFKKISQIAFFFFPFFSFFSFFFIFFSFYLWPVLDNGWQPATGKGCSC